MFSFALWSGFCFVALRSVGEAYRWTRGNEQPDQENSMRRLCDHANREDKGVPTDYLSMCVRSSWRAGVI